MTTAPTSSATYNHRPLHCKVAAIDDQWSTVGSSNLDPLRLSLNLEANVMIRDRAFARHLRERLEHVMLHHCRLVEQSDIRQPKAWLVVRSFFVFHFLRYFPAWAAHLPLHTPEVRVVEPGTHSPA